VRSVRGNPSDNVYRCLMTSVLEDLWQDLRYWVRNLFKRPGFTLGVVASLGLGIGANTTIFSLADTLLLRPLPGVQDAEHLVGIYNTQDGSGYFNVSYRDYVFYREHNEVCSDLIPHWMITLIMDNNDSTSKVDGAIVSGDYFSVLGVKPALGRFFLREEDTTPGDRLVAVISFALWQRIFNSDPELVGKEIKLNGHGFNIIGIAPRGFNGTMPGLSSDVWVPTMTHDVVMPGPENLSKGNWYLMMIGRLKPRISVRQAQTALSIIADQLEQIYPETNKKRGVIVTPATGTHPALQGPIRAFIIVLTLIAGLVLLIACVNISNLLLARAVMRSREIATRLSLGASRARLLRQLLTESITLSLLSGAAGVLIAYWGGAIIEAMIPPLGLPLALDFTMDGRVFAFALILSVITGIVFGLVPALQSTRPDLILSLRDDVGGGSYRHSRVGSLLVVGQVTISTVLLTCAALFVLSLIKAQHANPGFDAKNVLLMSLDPGMLGYSDAKTARFYQDLLQRLRGLPGVQSTSLARFIPLGPAGDDAVVRSDEVETQPGVAGRRVSYNLIGPDYFDTLRISLVRGRPLDERDRDGAPGAVIINETMAKRYWPDSEEIGKRLFINDQPFTVVGVVGNTKYRSMSEQPLPFLFVSCFQRNAAKLAAGDMKLYVRTLGDPHALVAPLRTEIRTLDANQPVFDIQLLTEGMRFALIPTRLVGSLLGIAGLLGLVLSAVGIYSMVTYSVSQRTREVGVRVAMGATRRDILLLMLSRGVKLTATGVVIGLVLASLLARLMRGLLYGVTAADPFAFTVMPAFLIVVAMLACFLPARRAATMDPIVALRYE
jgi:predicted permease